MSEKIRQHIHDGFIDEAIGLEVHVDGWGTSPFFTVRGFEDNNGTVLLSKRYSRRNLYRVPRCRAYFTRPAARIYLRRIQLEGVKS